MDSDDALGFVEEEGGANIDEKCEDDTDGSCDELDGLSPVAVDASGFDSDSDYPPDSDSDYAPDSDSDYYSDSYSNSDSDSAPAVAPAITPAVDSAVALDGPDYLDATCLENTDNLGPLCLGKRKRE